MAQTIVFCRLRSSQATEKRWPAPPRPRTPRAIYAANFWDATLKSVFRWRRRASNQSASSTISTRRLLARPSSVSFDARGRLAPSLDTESRDSGIA